jgi:hypothetical protein
MDLICPLRNLSRSDALVFMGATSDGSSYVVHWNKTGVAGLSFEAMLRKSGAIVFKYSGVPANLVATSDYFVGLATAALDSHKGGTRSFKIDIPHEHLTSDMTVRYDPVWQTNPVLQGVSSASSATRGNHVVAVALVALLLVMSAASLLGMSLTAVRHPASCPGQLLVRIRMTRYRMFGGEEAVALQRPASWASRASIGTTDTTAD